MSLYADFLPRMVSPDGVIAGPADKGRVAAVARDDVAAVAAAVVAGEGHDGRTYEVTGPRAVTLAEEAAELSRLSGRRIVVRGETSTRPTRRAPTTAPPTGRSRPK